MKLPRLAWALFGGIAMPASVRAQPVVHLTFDNPSQLTHDTSGRGNNGSASGNVAAANNGVAGGAAQFSGDGFIGMDNSVASVLSGSFTLSLWVATTSASGSDTDPAFNGAGIIAAGGNSSTAAALGLTSGVVGFAGASDNATLHSQAAVNSGNFVHVVVTQDAATGARSVFVNGALDNQQTGSSISTAVQDILTLGANPGHSSYFSGLIDDFQVYNAALNANDVAYLHANPGSAVGALVVPEPGTWALCALGLGALAAWHRRRRPKF